VFRRRKSDPLGRQMVLAIAAGRVAVGVGTLFATRPALGVLGFGETDPSGLALAKRLRKIVRGKADAALRRLE